MWTAVCVLEVSLTKHTSLLFNSEVVGIIRLELDSWPAWGTSMEMEQHDHAWIMTVSRRRTLLTFRLPSYQAGYGFDGSLYQHFLVVSATCNLSMKSWPKILSGIIMHTIAVWKKQTPPSSNGMSARPRTSISPPLAPGILTFIGTRERRFFLLIDCHTLVETKVAVEPLSTKKAALIPRMLQLA